MKLVLTGATGFVGGEVLHQALADERITSVICLTRRDLPVAVSSNDKLQVIKLEDFTKYSNEVLQKLEGAEACVWAFGSPAFKNSNMAKCREIEIDCPFAAAGSFESYLAPALKEKGKEFHFVYLSGQGAVREAEKGKGLWLMPETRRIKGETERKLFEIQKEGNNFELSVVRPGVVIPKGSIIPEVLVGLAKSVRVDELAAVMIDEALGVVDGAGKGASEGRTVENDALRKRGKDILKGRK